MPFLATYEFFFLHTFRLLSDSLKMSFKSTYWLGINRSERLWGRISNSLKIGIFLEWKFVLFSRRRRRRFFDPHISPFPEQIEIIREQRGGGKKPPWRVQKEPSSWSKLWPSPHPSKKMSPPTADMKTYPPFYQKKVDPFPWALGACTLMICVPRWLVFSLPDWWWSF